MEKNPDGYLLPNGTPPPHLRVTRTDTSPLTMKSRPTSTGRRSKLGWACKAGQARLGKQVRWDGPNDYLKLAGPVKQVLLIEQVRWARRNRLVSPG